jgi:hypothetical protein
LHGDSNDGSVLPRAQVVTAEHGAAVTDSALDGGEYGVAHFAEGAEGLVAVVAHAEVAFGKSVEAAASQGVDEHGDLDAVASREGDGLKELATTGELPGERLQEAGETRLVKVEQGPRHQLGHSSAFVRELDGSADEGALERALDEGEVCVEHERADESLEMTGIGVGCVAVEKAHDLRLGHR